MECGHVPRNAGPEEQDHRHSHPEQVIEDQEHESIGAVPERDLRVCHDVEKDKGDVRHSPGPALDLVVLRGMGAGIRLGAGAVTIDGQPHRAHLEAASVAKVTAPVQA